MDSFLVNKNNPLPESYVPDRLIQEAETKVWIRKKVHQAFYEMNEAAKKAGLGGLVLVSGYRSYDHQEKVFNRKIKALMNQGFKRDEAISKASKVVAQPGTSEHQTGLAIDLTNSQLAKEEDPLIEAFEDTKHGKWLSLNAHLYGFILRYPKDKTHITHINYEPWHYRYVGTKHAREINKRGLCLEEYKQLQEEDKWKS